jgi:hypothetical protein
MRLIVNEFLKPGRRHTAPGDPEDRTAGFAHGGWQRPFDEVFAQIAFEGM